MTFSYVEVGATRAPTMPPGYGHLDRSFPLGHGREAFELAAEAMFDWRMHRGAGIRSAPGAARAADGVVFEGSIGWGPLSLPIRCRVVYVVDEPGSRGFAYGTLPGHQERGEELFLVSLSPGGEVSLRVRAFSRPATFIARAGGPVTRMVQSHVTNRYAAALRGFSRGAA